MAITDVVELDVLRSCFNLEPYDSLLRPAPASREDQGAGEVGGAEDGDAAAAAAAAAAATTTTTTVTTVTTTTTTTTTTTAAAAAATSAAQGGTSEGKKEDDIFGDDDEYADLEAARKAAEAKARAERLAEEARQARIAAGLPAEDEEVAQESESEEESVSDVNEPTTDEDEYLEEQPRPTLLDTEEASLRGTVPNVFAVTLFCLSEVLESRSRDFLSRAFAEYPDLEYCILTLPHTAAEFPLLKLFTLVPALPTSTLDHVLYLVHRDSLSQDLEVRPALPVDRAGLLKLLAGVETREEVMRAVYEHNRRTRLEAKLAAARIENGDFMDDEDERRAREEALAADPDASQVVYVMTLAGVTVGVAVMDVKVDVKFLQLNYDLDDFLRLDLHSDSDHARLVHLVLNPIFSAQMPYFVQTALRLMHKTTLYYHVYISRPTPATVIRNFIQVRPRRQPIHPGEPEPAGEPFALCITSARLLTEPRAAVNTRVVVVGASDCAVALLEALSFVPYLCFTNLTLVSPGGLPEGPPGGRGGGGGGASGEPQLLPSKLAYTRRLLRQLALEDRVREVEEMLVDIRRDEKRAIVADLVGQTTVLPYDYLVITAGLQDQTLARLPRAQPPAGAFTVSNEEEASALLQYVGSYFLGGSSELLVYGGTLQAYTVAQGLLDAGVPASRIRMIFPPSRRDFSCFNDARVDRAVEEALDTLRVRRHYGLALHNLATDESGSVVAAEFEKQGSGEVTRFECEVIVACDEPDVGRRVYHALNDNSLVYDGRLVVSSRFQTNDPCIFAAGTIAKFSRRYHQRLPMSAYSTRELGRRLADILLLELDPDAEGSAATAPDELPKLSDPVIEAGKVPGALFYYNIQTPKVPASHSVASAIPETYGRDLITVREDNRLYMRIHIDFYSKVEQIVHLGPEPSEYSNFTCLVGLPEAYLNRLVLRFDEGLITDLAAFFRANWAMGLFHDRFPEFRELLKNRTRTITDLKALTEKTLARWVEVNPRLDAAQVLELHEKLPPSVNAVAQQTLVDYLVGNRGHLHCYYVPTKDMEFAKFDYAPKPRFDSK
jgi:hypothetical protein